MKTPEQIAGGTLTDSGNVNSQGEPLYTLSLGELTVHNISESHAELMQDYAAAAIEADRAQRDPFTGRVPLIPEGNSQLGSYRIHHQNGI